MSRYDYFADLRLLVVRMPTLVHDDFLRNVANALWFQVTSIRQGDGEAAVFARNIRDSGSTSIRYKEGPGHDPDASYRFKGVKRPTVIIEVANSQKKKDLTHLANDYIIDSGGDVQVVVGLDIEYGRNKTRAASLSVWRPRVYELADGRELRAEQTVVDQLFREDNGNSTSYPGITLRLSDFAPDRFSKDLSSEDDVEINISCRQLCEFLDEAEEEYDEQQALPDTVPVGTRMRKLSKTPPQELTSDDERTHSALEDEEVKRANKDDSSYHGPTFKIPRTMSTRNTPLDNQ